MSILQKIEENKGSKKMLAVLIDPDTVTESDKLILTIKSCNDNHVDLILVGGSLITQDNFAYVILTIKSNSTIPVLIFPGNNIQIDDQADAILLLSLISGRNPDFLIGQHVLAAPKLRSSKLEIIPMGYLLVNSGLATSASYMSNTTPIPSNKPDIAACTAIAGEMLGLRTIYLDAGSGANEPIPTDVIRKVKHSINIPLVIGGGLNTLEKVDNALSAGADIIVVGNALEKDTSFLKDVSQLIQTKNSD